jgi:hypothetical protein
MSTRIVDPVYGVFQIDRFERELILSPEVQRLRDIRQSNINSLFLPGVANVSRYEHSIGVGHLARLVSNHLKLKEQEKKHLIASAILHDIATPPFGHTIEYILKERFGFDHETFASKIIQGDFVYPILRGWLSQSTKILRKYSLDPAEVSSYIRGEGISGKLINAEIDLDNIDNVVRTAVHTSKDINRYDPEKFIEGFALRNGEICFLESCLNEVKKWIDARQDMYHEFFADPYDWSAKTMLAYAFEQGVLHNIFDEDSWVLTDTELLLLLSDNKRLLELSDSRESAEKIAEIGKRFFIGDLFRIIGWYWVRNQKNISRLNNLLQRKTVAKELEENLSLEVILDFVPNNKYKPLKLTLIRPYLDRMESREVTLGERDTMWLLSVITPERNLTEAKISQVRNRCTELLKDILDEEVPYVPSPYKRLL